jgi:hypothetical protein
VTVNCHTARTKLLQHRQQPCATGNASTHPSECTRHRGQPRPSRTWKQTPHPVPSERMSARGPETPPRETRQQTSSCGRLVPRLGALCQCSPTPADELCEQQCTPGPITLTDIRIYNALATAPIVVHITVRSANSFVLHDQDWKPTTGRLPIQHEVRLPSQLVHTTVVRDTPGRAAQPLRALVPARDQPI